jgi:phage-related protein (TIGR01555 family)
MPSKRKKSIKTSVPVETKKGLDAFSNGLARLGFGTPSLTEGTSYPLTRFQWDYITLSALYRGSWPVRKVIDCVAEDMLKRFPQLNCEITPEEDAKFQSVVRKTMTGGRCLKALKWGRLFGGAAGIIIIKGHESILDQPLDLDDIPIGSYKGLIVFDRWSGITPSGTMCSDISNIQDFGLPAYYEVTTSDAQTFKVHSSRVLRFTGRDLTEWESQAEMRWGLSEVEILYEELKKRDNTSSALVNLMFRANVMALKMPDVAQDLALGTQEAQQRAMSVMQAQNHLMSNQSMLVLPAEGELSTHQYSFSGVADLYTAFMADFAGCAEIPMSRLFGRSASGLGASDEESSYIYYDSIGQKQNNQLSPVMDKLFPVIAMSTWGYVPDDLAYSYPSPRTLSEKERYELAKRGTEAILGVFNAGVIGRKTTLTELKNMSSDVQIFTSISDEMIEAADDDVKAAVAKPETKEPSLDDESGMNPDSDDSEESE